MTESDQYHGTLKSYATGFILCIVLTLISFFAIEQHWFSNGLLLATIWGLGLFQVAIQLILFLHLGEEKKPRWNLCVFSFMLTVLLIIVLGSLWIMANLNYNVMPKM